MRKIPPKGFTQERIKSFIKYFQNPGTIKTFTEGCCYWFATILYNRFKMDGIYYEPTIMYNPVENHFACKLGYFGLWDITGKLKADVSDIRKIKVADSGINSDFLDGFYLYTANGWYVWDTYKYLDYHDYRRVYMNCIRKEYKDEEDDE